MKRICAMTTVRNDHIFLEKWFDYYSDALGRKNLFVILDGHDQELPADLRDANAFRLPHISLRREAADARRARVMSHVAAGLHHYFDIVIAGDVDELIVVDPALGLGLAEYLGSKRLPAAVSSLGLDVGQHILQEGTLDLNRPFLQQRQFAHVSSRYTKPCIATRAVSWGAGMHRVKGKNFKIDPNLYLMHLGMIDYEIATGTSLDEDRLSTGWNRHLKRRQRLFEIVKQASPVDGDAYFPIARRYQTRHRSLFAWNKPAMIPGDPVVRIPERFRDLL